VATILKDVEKVGEAGPGFWPDHEEAQVFVTQSGPENERAIAGRIARSLDWRLR
jgi:hypothetical protein